MCEVFIETGFATISGFSDQLIIADRGAALAGNIQLSLVISARMVQISSLNPVDRRSCNNLRASAELRRLSDLHQFDVVNNITLIDE